MLNMIDRSTVDLVSQVVIRVLMNPKVKTYRLPYVTKSGRHSRMVIDAAKRTEAAEREILVFS